MGLDLVELVVEVEETFALSIADAEAQKIRTVGDLVGFVQTRVSNRKGVACMTSRTFYQFRSELRRVLPQLRKRIRPRADLEALISETERRKVWARLRAAGLDLPPLSVSATVFCLAAFAVLALPAALAWWYHAGVFLLVALPLCFLVWMATRPLAIHPHPYRTVRAAILYLAPVPTKTANQQEGLTDKEIAEKVRLIISANLGVPLDQLTDGARFVEDLGAE